MLTVATHRKRLNSIMSVDVLLYYKVKLSDESEGVVRYIGGIMGKKGVFYGIDLTKGNAKNKGTFEGIEYFKTKKGTVTGRFVTATKIKTWSKTKYAKYPFKLNEKVFCKKTNCTGVIKYIGVPAWTKNNHVVYYGLELAEKKGNTNGMMKKTAYFKTKKQFGIYVPYTDIVDIKNNNNKQKKKPIKNFPLQSTLQIPCKKKKKKKKREKKKKKNKKHKKHQYIPSNDIDIDMDYEWNVNVAVADAELDDEHDSDIDVEYDWNNNCIEEVTDDDAFDLDFLDIPHYGDMDENERLSGVFRINISANEFILKSTSDDDSPLSVLSEHDYSDEINIISFKPSDTAMIKFNVIVENENKNENEYKLVDINMKQIDDALANYYKSFGRLDYVNNGTGKSIFIQFCEDNDIGYKDIDTYFKSESIEDYTFLQFDKDFPLNLLNEIDIHDSMDMFTKQHMRIGEMHTIIKYCYETKKSPY